MYGLLSVDGCKGRGRERGWGIQTREGGTVWVRRQTKFGVVVAQSIDHLLNVVSEWTSGDCVCVRACACACARARVCV